MLLLNGQVVEAALGLVDTPNLPVDLVVTFAQRRIIRRERKRNTDQAGPRQEWPRKLG